MLQYTIEKSSDVPSYIQLYNFFKRDIIKGVYSFGEKLPSKRIISSELGISLITVEHGLSLLCDEGYIETRERSGYYVVYDMGADILRPREDFGQSTALQTVKAEQSYNKSEFPFSVYARTMRKIISERGGEILSPSPYNGTYELRSALSSYLAKSRGIDARADNIIIGSGSTDLYNSLAALLEGDFAIENPSYGNIRRVYELAGVRCIPLNMGSEGILSEELFSTSASVLHVTPYRSYPTRITASASKRYEYIRWAEKNNAYIIEDDFESEFTVSTKAEETLFAMEGGMRVIYLNTFTETIAPGIRVGYILLPEELSKKYREKLGFLPCTVPTFEQLVLAELISSGDFERHINRVRRARRAEQQ